MSALNVNTATCVTRCPSDQYGCLRAVIYPPASFPEMEMVVALIYGRIIEGFRSSLLGEISLDMLAIAPA